MDTCMYAPYMYRYVHIYVAVLWLPLADILFCFLNVVKCDTFLSVWPWRQNVSRWTLEQDVTLRLQMFCFFPSAVSLTVMLFRAFMLINCSVLFWTVLPAVDNNVNVTGSSTVVKAWWGVTKAGFKIQTEELTGHCGFTRCTYYSITVATSQEHV